MDRQRRCRTSCIYGFNDSGAGGVLNIALVTLGASPCAPPCTITFHTVQLYYRHSIALGPHPQNSERTRLSGLEQPRMFMPQAPVCPGLIQTNLRSLPQA